MSGAQRAARAIVALLAVGALAACGSDETTPAGVMAQTCSPNNPYRGDASAATQVGNIGSEKTWLRDYIDRQYLWYDEVPNVNPGLAAYSNDTLGGFYTSIDDYFNALLTPAHTPSGKLKDQFSFTYPTALWDALINSGSSVGYGIEWHFGSTTPPREIRVAYVHAGSTAEAQGIVRGDTLVLADNVSADDNTSPGVATLNAALFPAANSAHTFRFARAGVATPLDRTMVASAVALTSVESTVLTVGGGQKVGYLLFNDHVLTAEQPLINAFAALQSAGVSDLVLDLRYNGGGYLYIASEVGTMIAGAGSANGQVFENTVFNRKRTGENDTTFFPTIACVPNPNTFQCTTSAALPSLNLSRVYVLVSGSTCSASEAILNGLRGIGVQVHLIGSTTCGKPYGFFGQDNCGVTYFPIEFQGVNAQGFGDYADGFVPGGNGTPANRLPGCAANDDLDHALGDPAEGQLAAALSYRASGNTACLPVMASPRASPLSAGGTGALAQGRVIKPAVLTNRNGRTPSR